MGFFSFIIILGCVAAIFNGGDAAFGPPIEIPSSDMKNFVLISVPLIGHQSLGIIVSKKYFVAYVIIGVVPPEFVEIRYGDLSTAPLLPLVNSYYTENYYAVGKVCSGIYGTPVSLNPSSFPTDYTQNRTADYVYARTTENKYYKRSIDILANDRCMDDQIGTNSEGDTFEFDFVACIAHDKAPGTCSQWFELDQIFTLPWVVFNDQPLGLGLGTECDYELDNANGTEVFLKLSSALDTIKDLAPPGAISLP